MAEKVASLVDLPIDILHLVFPYLDVKDFLSLCSTCKALQDPSIRLDPVYWSYATKTTFRVPNQPLAQANGERWQKMYRRMLTQSHAFTWGRASHNRLGHSFVTGTASTAMRHRRQTGSRASFPIIMDGTKDLGIISDMQCGGWSTTLLNSKGLLFTAGALDGITNGNEYSIDGPQRLHFPSGFPHQDVQYTEPTTAIRQFSSGRSHILGLADSGRIWSWHAASQPARHIKFIHFDIKETSLGSEPAKGAAGSVREVVAGWSYSSAYVSGTGIVLWPPQVDAIDKEADTVLVMDSIVIPQTAYQRPKGSVRENPEQRALGEQIGSVTRYIVLENFVVFVTDIGKVFVSRMSRDEPLEMLEIRALRNDTGKPTDVQGSFKSFAIFKGGEVITCHQDFLEACWEHRNQEVDQSTLGTLSRIPALQNNNVISIAFGDYHFLALHSTGKITAYGREVQAYGALGLGGDADPEGRTRGFRQVGGFDRQLIPHAYTNGRQVWFQGEKRRWITYMTSGGKNPQEAMERLRLFVTDPDVQGEVSEWFEQEGQDWDKAPELQDANEDGLGVHFALQVCAAGWHSGALVLVNEELEKRVSEKCIVEDKAVAPGFADNQARNLRPFTDPISHGASPAKGYKYTWAEDSFPRLKLADGREMPGEVPFAEWRFGRPEFKLDITLP